MPVLNPIDVEALSNPQVSTGIAALPPIRFASCSC